MAYFKWQGIDLRGQTHEGKMFARSEQALDAQLFKQEIALIACTPILPRRFAKAINLDEKIHFFRQLSALLDAGVHLPDALEILCDLITNIQLQEIIHDLSVNVQEGVSLSQALALHPATFDSLMIRMVRVGQETGRLAISMEQLANYLDITNSFAKKLKSAAMLPLITLGFFMLIATVIFTVIVPRFADIFKSMNKELPGITKAIIAASDTLRSGWIVLFGSLTILAALLLARYAKSEAGKPAVDRILVRIPWIGDLIKNSSLTYFLHSLSMLLTNGIVLVKSLQIAGDEIKNSVVLEQVKEVEAAVTSGVALSQAMARQPHTVFENDIVSIARVGEESGNLGTMMHKAAALYQEKVNRSIGFFTTIFQPLLMIILGLLITLLIFAIYLPVFNLASVV